MELTILGSGTGVPSAKRSSPGYFLKVKGRNVLFDGGSGTLRRMEEAGLSYKDVDIICYTHGHPDHVMDLVPFLFATKNTPDFERKKPLTIYGPRGTRRLFDRFSEMFGEWIASPSYRLTLKEIGEQQVEFEGWRFRTRYMAHSRYALGYRIEEEGGAIAYSGDTEYCPGIVDLGTEADVLLLECSFPEGQEVKGHLTPKVAGRIAREARCRKLVLTHFYPPCEGGDLIAQCREEFSGEIILAEDLMKLLIG